MYVASCRYTGVWQPASHSSSLSNSIAWYLRAFLFGFANEAPLWGRTTGAGSVTSIIVALKYNPRKVITLYWGPCSLHVLQLRLESLDLLLSSFDIGLSSGQGVNRLGILERARAGFLLTMFGSHIWVWTF